MSVLKISALVAATLIGAQAAVCGSNGYSTTDNDYYYDDSGKQGNYASCSQVCVKDSKCKSFAFSSSTCILYPNAVSGSFDADNGSPYKFYDRACVSTTTTSTTTTSILTSSTSKSTTKTTSTTATSKSSSSTSTTSTSKSSSSAGPTSTSKSSSSSSTSPISTSTAKASSTTASAPASSTSAVVVPSGCTLPTSYTITGFSWFNSTHNLDCITGPDVGDGTGCLDSNGNWCDPNKDSTCTHCGVAVCSTGLPPQPVGYGPPDDVKFTYSDGTVCEQVNPAGYRRYPVGNGQVGCGSAYPFMFFYGDSNPAKSTGNVQVNSYGTTCSDGQTIVGHYETTFPVSCTHDAQFNATCATSGNVVVPLISFTKN